MITSASVILNAQSGRCLEQAADTLPESLFSLFKAGGIDAQIIPVKGCEIAAATTRACEAGTDAVIVAGGDGTILEAAKVLLNKNKPLGILPCGTMNLMARDLGIPLDWEEAVRALAGAGESVIDVAEVNGHIYLCVSMIGLFPRIARQREKYRGRPFWVQYPQVFLSALRAFFRYPLLSVDVFTGGERRHFFTRTLAVSNNPLCSEVGRPPYRETLDSGTLGIYISRHRSRLSMARLTVKLLLGLWQDDEDIELIEAPEIAVRTRRFRRLSAMNDGELLRLSNPLSYKIRPKALRVLMPKAAG